MRRFRALAMASVVLTMGLGTAGSAAPPVGSVAEPDNGIILVGGCHSDVRRHYVPEFGRTAWHRHRQSNCRPIRADPPEEDIQPRDCHRDVQRHYLPQYNRRVWHRHTGNSCRVQIYEEDRNGGGGRNCIQVGPIRVCQD